MYSFSVRTLNQLLAELFEEAFPQTITVEGEISNFSESNNKHWYFTLKEEDAQIKAVMFKWQNQNVQARPQNGDKVRVSATLSFYKERGDCQLICSAITPLGIGQLLAKIEERKKQLASEGLFNPELKKPMPIFPYNVGIITSTQGAALQDMLRVFREKNTPVNIHIFHSMVQGNNAGNDIANKIKQVNQFSKKNPLDIIVIGRGGGSTEDLLAYSDEVVVRAIAQSNIPIISGVGHETDTPLSDFAADIQVPTPTASAVLISQQIFSVIDSVHHITETLTTHCNRKIHDLKSRFEQFSIFSLEKTLLNHGAFLHQKIDRITEALQHSVLFSFSEVSQRIQTIHTMLQSSSPEAILKRGYSLVYDKDEKSIITNANTLNSGNEVALVFQNGKKHAIIK